MAPRKKTPPTAEQIEPKFIHNYTPINQRPVVKEQHNADDTRTERAGYVPMEHRIRNIEAAGRRLDKARREQYHYGEGEPVRDNFTDFATDTNLDLVDIDGVVHNGSAALEESQRARTEAQAQQTAKKREELEKTIKEAQASIAKMPDVKPTAEPPGEPSAEK